MKIRRKSNRCLNCDATLDGIYNYCPKCGQENTDNNVSFKMLTADFFNTYLAVDSKFAKTVKPFFINPGYLTNQYMDGKRNSYAHPIRLYLIISIFYFFILNMAAKTLIANEEGDDTVINLERSVAIEGLTERENDKINNLLSEATIEKITGDSIDVISINEIEQLIKDFATEGERNKLLQKLDTVTLQKIGLLPSDNRDSLIAATKQPEEKPKTKMDSLNSSKEAAEIDEEDDFILGRMNWKVITKYRFDKKITDKQIYDSLKLEPDITAFERLTVKQTIRIIRADKEQVVGYVLSNLPLMMLILIPLFALVLKLLYIRRKKELYIKHLIHALHLHSFSYFMYGCCIMVMLILDQVEEFNVILGFVVFAVVSFYAYISFLRVYKQSKVKTFIKFNLVGLVYISTICVAFTFEMLLSILLF